MKKKLLSLFLSIGIIVLSFGQNIDLATAKKIAKTYLNVSKNKSYPLIEVKLNDTSPNSAKQNANSNELIYIFNSGTNNGYVIIAGDDRSKPVLGYSLSGTFDKKNLPPNLRDWLKGYEKELNYIIDNNIKATAEIKNEWTALKRGSKNLKSKTTAVSPLLTTTWNQKGYYNDLCPEDSPTGCVATAMAQIMNYWEYPKQGTGFHSYNENDYGTLSANFGSITYQWNLMTNNVTSPNNAVATLMYHCGVSVDMDYSPSESSAYASSTVNAFTSYFGYANSIQIVSREYYTLSLWIQLLKTELDAGHPMGYRGSGSSGGHYFVCDGYDNNEYFHFNWGWGGAYDGYFMIDVLNPSYTFNSGQQVVIGIKPPTEEQTFDMRLYDNVTPSSSTISYGQPFTINTNIANYGGNIFYGDFTVAIYDNSNNFIEYVETLSGYTLQGGHVYSNNLVFSTTGILGMSPGTYYAVVLYKPTGGDWIKVEDDSYSNSVQMIVTNPDDVDGDGVMNDVDNCPDTPNGEEVNATGCSQSQIDDDGDGVMNDVDTCSNTPAAEEVNATGCSQSQIDDDDDGVMNNIDTCPDTPSGEAVNATGCSQSQIDDDGDGIMNDIDLCPNTPTGESVNETGCSESQLDDDNDGVMNNIDTCPDTPIGENVNATGCSESQIDDDGDGVMNNIDTCPDTPAGEDVNETGCSQSQIDDDLDGVMNNIDTCPDTPTGENVNATGCSQSQIDDDGDGVMNNIDTCLDTPTGEDVNETGCSESQLDDDNDGVMNNLDLCPNSIVGTIVNENGCFFLPSNNFSISILSETCPGKNNGELTITANEIYSYTATINGTSYNFSNNSLTVPNLQPGTYSVCISVVGETFEQCYTVVISEGTTISGKSSITSTKASIDITRGTAPYNVFLNGEMLLETNSRTFDLNVKHGDLIQVKTAVDCEGIFSKTIDLFETLTLYPNPTNGIFEVALPLSLKEVKIELFTTNSKLITSKIYSVENGKVKLNIDNLPSAMYLVKVYLENPVSVKIIKK